MAKKKKSKKSSSGRKPTVDARTTQRPPAQAKKPASQRPHDQQWGAVPGVDAFDNLPKRSAPNLPGREGYQEPRAAATVRNEQHQQHGNKRVPAPKARENERRERPVPQEAERANALEKTQKKRNTRKRKPAKRRKFRRLRAILLVLVLIVAGGVFSVNVVFKIETFKLDGETGYTLEEVEQAFGKLPGDNMFGFNTAAASKQIEQTLPYVESVKIKRSLPSTIVFKVTEATDRYTIPASGQYAVLNNSFKVLRMAETPPEGLVQIRGIDDASAVPGVPLTVADADKKEALDILLAILEQKNVADVTWVDVSNPVALQYGWQNRITVILGAKTSLSEKLDLIQEILTKPEKHNISEAERGVLDVSDYAKTKQVVFKPNLGTVEEPVPEEVPPEETQDEPIPDEAPPE